MKKTVFIVCCVAFLGLAGVTYAASKMPRTEMMEKSPIASMGGARMNGTRDNGTSAVENLKHRATGEIERRVTALSDTMNRISKMQRLSDEQKSKLLDEITSQINSLDALKAKIDADTDITALKADVKSIVDTYRIFAVYLPTTRIIIAADGILDVVDKLNNLAAKLQIRIEQAKSEGKNTASLEKALAELQSDISDAQSQAEKAITAVVDIQPTNYPGNKTDLQTARKMLQTAWKDLQDARTSAQKIFFAVEGSAVGKNSSGAATTNSLRPVFKVDPTGKSVKLPSE